jgi:hypothetical protein
MLECSRNLRPSGRGGCQDPKTTTNGGNNIKVKAKKLHAMWDAVPSSLEVSHISTLLKVAKKVPATNGQIYDWPVNWADGTLAAADQAFTGLKFSSL